MAVYDPGAVVDTSKVAVMAVSDPFDPDDCTPQHVRDAAVACLDGHGAHYSTPFGERDLRELIAEKVARVNGLEVDPDRNITVSPGADPLLTFCARPFLEPGAGHEILTPIPAFNSNLEVGALTGGVTVPVPTREEDGFELRMDEFERLLTPRTKLVLLTNPNNPTTTVYSRRSLEQLAEFAIANDLVVISDQAFEELVFDGHEMTDIAALPGMAERTIVICSLSKGMGLSGYRIGYAVASEDITDVLHSCVPHVFGAPNTVAQAAAVAALRDPGFVESYRREYMARAARICALLDTVPQLRYVQPRSGFCVWLNVAAYGGASTVAEYLLREAHVMVTEGGMFGSEDHIRLVYAAFAQRERCLDAVERVVDALRRLSPQDPTPVPRRRR
ncbi:MAG: pyridoxal phosphate-dependent aminotransferase [Actinobacteria bacterium]|nr:pyridoxal phosphate-dependent aminotransferase [Actinomycetota bacterium]